MFTSLRPDFSLKQVLTFVAALWLQATVLVILCSLPARQGSGPSIRRDVVHSASVTHIYFQKDTVASTPEPMLAAAHLKPKPQNEPRAAEQEPEARAEGTNDGAGDGDGQGLAPFPSWKMNTMPSGFAFMHHQIKTALPVFTPDPPILHSEVPEFARGKDVVLDVVISDQGSIVQVSVMKAVGNGIEESIVQTLQRWIFVPAKFNGVAIASRRQLLFHFPG
jgi:hypothetical protein